MRLSIGKILALKPYVLRTYPERRKNWADPSSGHVTLFPFMECRLKVTISGADLSSNTNERIESVKVPARTLVKTQLDRSLPTNVRTTPQEHSDSLPGIIIIMPRGKGDPAS